jgi:hypothetical protein
MTKAFSLIASPSFRNGGWIIPRVLMGRRTSLGEFSYILKSNLSLSLSLVRNTSPDKHSLSKLPTHSPPHHKRRSYADAQPFPSRYTLYFGKGTRVCLGMHLVYAELPIVIAMLFRSFEFELFETDREDVDCYFDQIAPGVKPGSKGVRAIVKSAVF